MSVTHGRSCAATWAVSLPCLPRAHLATLMQPGGLTVRLFVASPHNFGVGAELTCCGQVGGSSWLQEAWPNPAKHRLDMVAWVSRQLGGHGFGLCAGSFLPPSPGLVCCKSSPTGRWWEVGAEVSGPSWRAGTSLSWAPLWLPASLPDWLKSWPNPCGIPQGCGCPKGCAHW